MPRILWLLALGAFAIGTDAFVIAGVLPGVAGDLGVSVGRAGLLVTVFAVVYALIGPVLAVVTSSAGRRLVLVAALLAFAAANALAAIAPTYGWLLTGRVLAAVSAALFMPSAAALAVSLVDEALRGRALAVVYGGLTLATAVGVPLGTLIAAGIGWRGTFSLVAALGVLAGIGVYALWTAVPKPPVASLRQRIEITARPAVLGSLALTVVTLTGGFTVYTYIAPVLAHTAGARGAGLSALLLVWGLAAAAGNGLGGNLTDRWGPARVLALALATLTCVFAVLAAGVVAGVAATVFWLVIWGIAAWMTIPALQHRVVGLASDAPAVALSLNGSAIYIGVALGGALGSALLKGGTAKLATGALAAELAAVVLLALLAAATPRPTPTAAPASPASKQHDTR